MARTPFLIIIKNRGGFFKGARAVLFALSTGLACPTHAVRSSDMSRSGKPVSQDHVDVQGIVEETIGNLPELRSVSKGSSFQPFGSGPKNIPTVDPVRRTTPNFSLPSINFGGMGSGAHGGNPDPDAPPSGDASGGGGGSGSGGVGNTEAAAPSVALSGPGSASPKSTLRNPIDNNVNFYLGSNRCKAGVIVFGHTKCYATNRGGYTTKPPNTVENRTHSGTPCSYLPADASGGQSQLHSSIGPLPGGAGRPMNVLNVADTGTAGKSGGVTGARNHYNGNSVIQLGAGQLMIHSRDYIGNTLESLESGNSWGCTLVGPDCMAALANYVNANPNAQFIMHESETESVDFNAY